MLFPLCRVPLRILGQFPRVTVQSHATLEDEVRCVNDAENNHVPPARELAPYQIRAIQRHDQSEYNQDEEPFRQRILEPDESDQAGYAVWPAVDDEAENETCVLRDEVVGQLSQEEE